MREGTTNARAVPRFAWSLWALSVALTVFVSTVGALVGSRRSQNPVGWLLCLYGLAQAVEHFSSQYAIYALLCRSDSLPAGEAMAWGSSWILPPPEHSSLWLRRTEDPP